MCPLCLPCEDNRWTGRRTVSRSISGDNVLSIRVLQKETQHNTGNFIRVLQKKHNTTQASLSVFYRKKHNTTQAKKHNTTEHCTVQPGLSETIIGSTLRLRPFRRHRHRLTRCSPNTELILLFLPNMCFLIILPKLVVFRPSLRPHSPSHQQKA